ncbi:MAG: SHOCT domain-containing protein [Alphaproteobacteria bacterium]|nr:SHOCT domain-containing protein [Alphaproteobacteria bacterium]
MNTTDKQYQANRLAGYERLYAIIWIIISIIQILSVYLILAGIWNIFCVITSFKLEKKILNRDADVPQEYENITGLVITGIVNVLLGGILGIILVGFGFWIRQEVLAHRDIFDNTEGVSNENLTLQPSLSNYEQLEKLYELKQKGILSEEEYNKEKNRLL